MTLLQDYTTLKADTRDDELAWQLHLERLIFSAEAELRWLEKVEARLEAMPAIEDRVDDPAVAVEAEVKR